MICLLQFYVRFVVCPIFCPLCPINFCPIFCPFCTIFCPFCLIFCPLCPIFCPFVPFFVRFVLFFVRFVLFFVRFVLIFCPFLGFFEFRTKRTVTPPLVKYRNFYSKLISTYSQISIGTFWLGHFYSKLFITI